MFSLQNQLPSEMAASASASSSSPRQIFVWQNAFVPGSSLPAKFDAHRMKSSRWLIQVIQPNEATGRVTSHIVNAVLKVHRSPEYRDWPQILVVICPSDDAAAHAVIWNMLQLQFDTLVVVQCVGPEQWKAFDAPALQMLVTKFDVTRANAAQLEVALSQKEMIVAAQAAMNKISSVRHMINDMVNTITPSSVCFLAGDSLVSPSDRRRTVHMELSGFTPENGAKMQNFWASLLQRADVVAGSKSERDISLRVLFVDTSATFTLDGYRPGAGFVYHLFLVARSLDSSKTIPASLYAQLYKQSFQLGLHFDVISCTPSPENLESALECALRNAKDGLEAYKMMAGVDTSQPQQAAEADVDRMIDDSVALIKEAKNED